jgi:hypothetical protein
MPIITRHKTASTSYPKAIVLGPHWSYHGTIVELTEASARIALVNEYGISAVEQWVTRDGYTKLLYGVEVGQTGTLTYAVLSPNYANYYWTPDPVQPNQEEG